MKILFSICLGIFPFLIQAKDNLPTIKATSPIVDIRVGDELFLKAGWHLNPEADPDVFQVGSKWLYDEKSVCFYTDLDSISFIVQPGDTVDFLIILNENTLCPTQIVALPNPTIWGQQTFVSMLIGLFLLIAIFLWYSPAPKGLLVKILGIGSPLLFWSMTFISGSLQGEYHHLRNTISELGKLGSPGEAPTSWILLALAMTCFLFSVAFLKKSRELGISIAPALLTFPFAFAMGWAGYFPLGNFFHGILGPLPLLLILSPLSALFLWRKVPVSRQVRVASGIALFLMLLILLRFVRPFGFQFEGLVQRFFYLGWTLWLLALGIHLGNNKRSKN